MIIKKIVLIICIILVGSIGTSFAEPVMITRSYTMDKANFDGKWSFLTEWKMSSLNTLSYDDGTIIQLRTAHQENYIYVFIDVVTKNLYNKGSDRAIVCFDKNDIKIVAPNENDYCFVVSLDQKSGIVLQGGSPLSITSGFKKIPNSDGFIGVSSISDENDRYSTIPHPSYEFRIPTDLVGRSDNYGFYVGVYDTYSNKVYSWPQDVSVYNSFEIPSPKNWGQMISPDKSLPEFQWPMLVFLPAFFFAIYLTKFRYR